MSGVVGDDTVRPADKVGVAAKAVAKAVLVLMLNWRWSLRPRTWKIKAMVDSMCLEAVILPGRCSSALFLGVGWVGVRYHSDRPVHWLEVHSTWTCLSC